MDDIRACKQLCLFTNNEKHAFPARQLTDSCAILQLPVGRSCVLTLKHGANLPPGSHPALAGVLAQRRLQDKQGHTTEEEEDKVRDKEGTWKY